MAESQQIARQGGLLVFLGERGCGKTQAATLIAARLWSQWRAPSEEASDGWRAPYTMYRKALDVFAAIRAGFGEGADEWKAMRNFRKCYLLVIDEIQERGNTDFEDRTLTHIIDTRYDAMLPTILIGNIKPTELAKQLGPSIASRCQETGKVKVFPAVNYRAPRNNP